jgi:hypothetical protein
MTDKNQSNKPGFDPLKDDLSKRGKGMQGIDKAPGEEPAHDTERVIYETQRGKNKVDGDPSKESDQPINQH